jgi:hypothetical protein
LRKTAGGISKKSVALDEVGEQVTVKGGKLRVADSGGTYTPVDKIFRAAYSIPDGDRSEIGQRGLKRGGIFSFLDRFRHGRENAK